jgi:methionyl-tRNA formyltransferase
MQAKARIIYAGSPDFAVPALTALLASSHEVVAVLTQPDRPSGRGRKLAAGPVKQLAQQAGVPVLQPESLRDASIQAQLRQFNADLLVVVAYGLLLPVEVLAIPRLACINLHASLLPHWRGAAPIQMAILNGDQETGVCIMQMDEGLDTGPVYAVGKIPLSPQRVAGELDAQLAGLGAALLLEHLDAILDGRLQAQPQADIGASYARRIKKADGVIDWHNSARHIDRQIHAYNPWPVAQTTLDGELLRCWQSTLPEPQPADQQQAPGTVLAADAEGISVQTGAGVVLLTRVQQAGRKQVSAADFARSTNLSAVTLGNQALGFRNQ